MSKSHLKLPEKGTYKSHLCAQWLDQFKGDPQGHIAYIALHLAGSLDLARGKLKEAQRVIQLRQGSAAAQRAQRRLDRTVSARAIAYEREFQDRGADRIRA